MKIQYINAEGQPQEYELNEGKTVIDLEEIDYTPHISDSEKIINIKEFQIPLKP